MKYAVIICFLFVFSSFTPIENQKEEVKKVENVGFVNCKEGNNAVWSKVFGDKATENLFVQQCLNEGRNPVVVYVN
ncbi:hypothetical protein [Aureivirga sp. CE67]|uniref:hypothetical protein n=1 Tax=Aureivirga sp. CE67 TaxID=1788983 RepID=UPI0018C8FFB0|nr:hypothetical protein [Aureivirga sp. CE67]